MSFGLAATHGELRGRVAAIATGKLLRTPADPSVAIIDGTRRLLEKQSKPPAELDLFIHATTLVTNTIIERKGATYYAVAAGLVRIVQAILRETS